MAVKLTFFMQQRKRQLQERITPTPMISLDTLSFEALNDGRFLMSLLEDFYVTSRTAFLPPTDPESTDDKEAASPMKAGDSQTKSLIKSALSM